MRLSKSILDLKGQTMADQTYNGWVNYETWCVTLGDLMPVPPVSSEPPMVSRTFTEHRSDTHLNPRRSYWKDVSLVAAFAAIGP